jgi:hypothetical protein
MTNVKRQCQTDLRGVEPNVTFSHHPSLSTNISRAPTQTVSHHTSIPFTPSTNDASSRNTLQPTITFQSTLPCPPNGAGGCVAIALASMGVISNDSSVVASALDGSIDTIWKHMQKASPGKPRHYAGIDGQEWHITVIRDAMAMDGHKYYLQKEVAVDGDWSFMKCNRKNMEDVFLVDGCLNPTYHRVMPGGHTKICHHDGWNDPKYIHDSAWRHAIAIKNGRLMCHGLSTSHGGVTIKNLWLDAHGVPGPKGYMKRILKVYRLRKSKKGFIPKSLRILPTA